MKHSNISIFVPHVGCPHMCSFCNQNTISGADELPDGESVRKICSKALSEVKYPENTEIAFFGGSFTAIPKDYMLELLTAAHEYVGDGKFSGIRVSTRPDYINAEILEMLKSYGVTAIELGAQSLDDEVLTANERGHSAEDVVNASRLIKEYGFELGLQMMTGLYKSDLSKDMNTAEKIIEIAPDTVRIYPVVVLKGTKLGQLYEQGKYPMINADEMFMFCAELITAFENSGIKVIKCGLHASEFVEKDMAAGYYHPAFREICEMYIYRREIMKILEENGVKSAEIEVNDKCISKAKGQKKANTLYFAENGFNVVITGNAEIPVYKCRMEVLKCTLNHLKYKALNRSRIR